MFYFDPFYFILLAPAFLLSAWASWATRSRFEKWSRVPNRLGIRGAEVARAILDRNGLHTVRVMPAGPGHLNDHYDPRSHTVRLSDEVYHGASVSSLAVAAHEVGHAIQHARGYAPLALRNLAVPLATFGSNFGLIIIMVGALISMTQVMWLGVILFGAAVAFQVITLPVELDASARAKTEIVRHGLAIPAEQDGVRSVLNAAAMTYVGAALSSILTLAYYVIRLGLLGGRRDER